MSVMSSSFVSRHVPLSLHSQDSIRENTMAISSRPLQSPSPHRSSITRHKDSEHEEEAFIFPDVGAHSDAPHRTGVHSAFHASPATAASSMVSLRVVEDNEVSDVDLEASTSTLSTQPSGAHTPRAATSTPQPSALSLLLARHDGRSRSPSRTRVPESESEAPTPTMARPELSTIQGTPRSHALESASVESATAGASSARGGLTSAPPSHAELREARSGTSDESAPLLAELESGHRTYYANGSASANGGASKRGSLTALRARVIRGAGPLATDAVRAVPAVILGTLLNVLDGISCA